MSEDDLQKQQAKKLLSALDDAINTGPWEKSIFLRAIGKKLREIRYNFKTRLNLETDTEKAASIPDNLANRVAQRAGQKEAFVSLYNAEGNNLQKWEKLVFSLDKQVVTRPVYSTEKEVRAMIRSKVNKQNEAYAAVYISQADIITPPAERVPVDRLGHHLLILKDGAIKLDNLTRFLHITGVYVFKDRRLIRQGDMEYMEFD